MRCLHVGNIANNGYLAAKYERDKGFESFLINVNSHHVMMHPEWEEANLNFKFDQFAIKELEDFKTVLPYWVLNGSWQKIYANLILIESTQQHTKSRESDYDLVLSKLIKNFRRFLPRKLRPYVAYNILYRFRKFNDVKYMIKVFNLFDNIIFYGPFVHLSRYVKNQTYIAFEHGTLRNFVDSKYTIARNTKSGFQNATVVLVSNQDSLEKAKALARKSVLKSPHPINDSDFLYYRQERKMFIGKKKDLTFNVLVPARHTFPINTDIGKGNEIIYSAIDDLIKIETKIVFHLINWGENLPIARKKLYEMQKNGFVKWHDLMTRPKLREFMLNCDAVIDQLLIPAYGGISIDSIGLGIPLLTRQESKIDLEYFGSVAPIFSVTSKEDLIRTVIHLISMSTPDRFLYFEESCRWFDANLSSKLSFEARIQAYRILGKK